MATEVLERLFHANLVAAIAILLVLLLRAPLARLAGPRAAYVLWGVVPLAAAASLAPVAAPIPIPIDLPDRLPAALIWMGEPAARLPEAFAGANPEIPTATALLALWIAGALAGVAAALARHRGLVRRLGRLTLRPDGVLQTGVNGVGPAVLGALSPRIIVPAEFDDRFTPAERAAIIAHERTHLRSGDAQVNALVVLARCVMWFNPLVHLAAHYLRLDQELACDASVLARDPASRRTYAEALLKSQLPATPITLGCAWPAHGAHPLRRRLAMLKAPRPGRARRLLGGLAVVATAAGASYAAWAARPVEVAASVVAEITTQALGEHRRVTGRLVRVSRTAAATEVVLASDDGRLWSVTSRGAAGEALGAWAKDAGPDLQVEGRLAINGRCSAVSCLRPLGPASTPAPAPARLAKTAAITAPLRLAAASAEAAVASTAQRAAPPRSAGVPGLAEHAQDLAPDPSRPVMVRGTVTRVEWRYPNAVIHMISYHDGRRWQIAGGAPSNLSRSGLTPETLAPGSHVLVRGYLPATESCAPECKAVGAYLNFETGEVQSLWGPDAGGDRDLDRS